MSSAKSILNEFTTWKWTIFILILFPYGWGVRSTIATNTNLGQLPMNEWEIIYTFLSNPSLILYFYLPFWLFVSVRLILKEWDYTLLIRLNSFSKWVIYSIIRISPILFIMQFLGIIISLLTTIGIPIDNSIWGTTSSPSNNVISALNETGLSPWVILFLHTALLSLFLVTIHVILALVYVRFRRMNVIAGTSVFIFMGAIITYKVFPSLPNPFEFGMVTNFSIFAFAYMTFDSVLPAFLVLFSIITFCFSLLTLWSTGRFQVIKSYLTDYYRFIVYIFLCLLGIAAPFTHSGMKFQTVWENFYFIFYGVSEVGFSLYVYIYFCIVFLGFTYLFQLHLSYILNGYIYFLIIRYKSYYSWFVLLMKKMILNALCLLLLLAMTTIVIGLIKGQSLEWNAANNISDHIPIPYIIYQFFINGFLQLLNYTFIVFIVCWVWQEATYNLIILGSLIVSGLPLLNSSLWLPSGLNSMGYVTANGTDVFHITIVLSIYLLIELGIIAFLFSKRKVLQ